jgi:enoyl-CoA hydratase/carnithine racemase
VQQSPELVRVEVDAGVATIRLDRPPMNAINSAMQEQLRAAAAQVSADASVRAVVLFGGEKVFAAGAGVKEFAGQDHAFMMRDAARVMSALDALARIPKPVIAAVTGYALGGGCELALTADFRISADNAKWGQPEILLGIIPGMGGTQRLPRLVGPAKAKDLIYTGRFVDASESLQIGLVDKVVPAASVYVEAVAWASQFSRGAAMALRAAKESIDSGLGVDLTTGLEIERQQFAALFATEDRTIGMKSFVENGPGKAEFKGK